MSFATVTDAVLEDATEAPAKGGFKEEASNGTAGTDGLFNALAKAYGGGGSSSSSSI